jgi:CRISPR/Cas system-associated endonuclease/helicase Cas3
MHPGKIQSKRQEYYNARKRTPKKEDSSDKALESRLEVDDFLPVACRVIHDKKGYVPRDVQLTAVVAFVSSDNQQQQAGRMPRRMGQISTGEGKTLISALVAIYHALRHWNADDRMTPTRWTIAVTAKAGGWST